MVFEGDKGVCELFMLRDTQCINNTLIIMVITMNKTAHFSSCCSMLYFGIALRERVFQTDILSIAVSLWHYKYQILGLKKTIRPSVQKTCTLNHTNCHSEIPYLTSFPSSLRFQFPQPWINL